MANCRFRALSLFVLGVWLTLGGPGATPTSTPVPLPLGQWVLKTGTTETVFEFFEGPRGTVSGRIVSRTDQEPGDRYFCANALYNGLPLVGTPWIWGLHPNGAGRWTQGMAVDTRNAQGNLFYCELRLEGDVLVWESTAGLGAGDRCLVLVRLRATDNDLRDYVWNDVTEAAVTKGQRPPHPVIDRKTDAVLGGSLYYLAILSVLVLSAVIALR